MEMTESITIQKRNFTAEPRRIATTAKCRVSRGTIADGAAQIGATGLGCQYPCNISGFVGEGKPTALHLFAAKRRALPHTQDQNKQGLNEYFRGHFERTNPLIEYFYIEKKPIRVLFNRNS